MMSNNDRSEEIYITEDEQMSEREYMQHLIDSADSWNEYAEPFKRPSKPLNWVIKYAVVFVISTITLYVGIAFLYLQN